MKTLAIGENTIKAITGCLHRTEQGKFVIEWLRNRLDFYKDNLVMDNSSETEILKGRCRELGEILGHIEKAPKI